VNVNVTVLAEVGTDIATAHLAVVDLLELPKKVDAVVVERIESTAPAGATGAGGLNGFSEFPASKDG
jgi:ABC-type methionine transport system permease subunit